VQNRLVVEVAPGPLLLLGPGLVKELPRPVAEGFSGFLGREVRLGPRQPEPDQDPPEPSLPRGRGRGWPVFQLAFPALFVFLEPVRQLGKPCLRLTGLGVTSEEEGGVAFSDGLVHGLQLSLQCPGLFLQVLALRSAPAAPQAAKPGPLLGHARRPIQEL